MSIFKIFIKENKFLVLFFIFFIITMILYDDNSFLYNHFVNYDEGVFLNIGKRMFFGEIPYKTIYDHKGPFVFFIYQILHLISIPGTTSGVFLYDFICTAISFYFIYKTNSLFHDRSESLIILFLIYDLLINIFFRNTGVPELLVMVLYSYLIYWLFSKKYKEDNLKNLYFITILSGIVFWLKFNLIIVPGILFLFYLVQVIIKEKKYKNLLHCFIGFIIPTIIVFIYFIKNDALSDLFKVYFLDNLGYRMNSLFAGNSKIFIFFMFFYMFIFIINIFCLKKQKNISLEFYIFYICFFVLILFQFLISNRYYLHYFYPCIPFFSFVLLPFKKIYREIFCVLIIFTSISIFSNCTVFNNYSENNFFTFEKDKKLNSLKTFFKEDDIVFCFSGTHVLYEAEKIKNDYYFYFPIFDYNKKPELWDTVLENIKNKNYNYIIIKKDSSGNSLLCGQLYSSENQTILNKILFYLDKNYYDLEILETYDKSALYLLKAVN